MDCAALYRQGIWLELYACSNNNTVNSRTLHVGLNKIQWKSIFQLAMFVQRAVWKKTYPIYCDCCRWISSTSCEKRGFNPISRASLIRVSTSLTEFALSFNFDQSRTYFFAKVGSWHANKNRNHIWIEISVCRYDEKWYPKLDKKATFTEQKSL